MQDAKQHVSAVICHFWETFHWCFWATAIARVSCGLQLAANVFLKKKSGSKKVLSEVEHMFKQM